MSSNKYLKILAIAFLVFAFIFCSKKDDRHLNLSNAKVVRNIAHRVLDENIRFTTAGNFTSDSTISIVAGVEASGRNQFGIQFKLLERVDGEFTLVYSTPVLNGSFDKCIVNKMKLYRYPGEMIYYNSKDFYMGTGGGEVYLYVINFSHKQVYYAHFVVEEHAGAALYLSENVEEPILKKFFINYFKKDYPSLHLVGSDIK